MPIFLRPFAGVFVLFILPFVVSCESSGSDGASTGSESRSSRRLFEQTGDASWYGPGFYGNRMASGQVYRPSDVAAAHPWLPFGTLLCVENLYNKLSVKVPVKDRGPYAGHRILDLTAAAADQLNMRSSGVVRVRLREMVDDTEACGEPPTPQECRTTLEAWHEQSEGDILYVTVDARCTASDIAVHLGSRNGARSKDTLKQALQVDSLSKTKSARVDFATLRGDGQTEFEAARVELLDAKARVLYRTGSDRPSPKIKPVVAPADAPHVGGIRVDPIDPPACSAVETRDSDGATEGEPCISGESTTAPSPNL